MIGTICKHCKKGKLIPHSVKTEGWRCPDTNHIGIFPNAGDCPECATGGKETALNHFENESHGYRCDQCGKSPQEAVKRDSWLKFEFEPEEERFRAAFVPKPAQEYADFLESAASSIPPCKCPSRHGLIRIGYINVNGVVRFVDGCCDETIAALKSIAER